MPKQPYTRIGLKVTRRALLTAAGAAIPVGFAVAGGPVVERFWVDPKLRGLPRRPWRKIHLDFHNSEYVEKIGADFHADEFGDALVKANVNAIVVFAKDMHGYFYYPSQYGPVHPGLDFDLLGAQVGACRQRKIEVYAYYCTTWDNYLHAHHPEWRRVLADGRPDMGLREDGTPGWTSLCLVHDGFVQLMLDHTMEFVSRYQIDGPWFDMPWPKEGTCWCEGCQRQMRDQGLDPGKLEHQRRHKHELYKSFLRRVREVSQTARPGCQVDFNEQGGYRLAERVAFSDNMDIEALPTASWGYFYFPANTRYMRTHGITTYGMTGRFQASWADFGGLKRPEQLEPELASIVAQAARCDIGDQMPPSGRLDPAVYHVIGKAFQRIRYLEPYLEGAVPVTEAAIVSGGLPFDKPSTPANYGLLKLLTESRVQFDIVEPDQPWERYGLVVLPDDQPVPGPMAERLRQFVDGGGAVIASHRGGLLEGRNATWLEPYGLSYAGLSPYRPAYLVPRPQFTGDLPAYPYALYEGASQWRAGGSAETLAALGEPAFQRTKERYTSHRQSPFDHETEYAALARSGRIGLVGFPVGLSYYNHGYWIYRSVFQQLLKSILPVQLVTANAPLSTEISLTHQAAGSHPERYLVHIVNYSALRATPRHPDFHEDPIALTDVTVRLHLPLKPRRVQTAVAGGTLRPRPLPGGGVEVSIRRIPAHEIVSFEL